VRVTPVRGLTVHSATGASVTAIDSFKAQGEFYDIQQQIQQPVQNSWVSQKSVNSKTPPDKRACPP